MRMRRGPAKFEGRLNYLWTQRSNEGIQKLMKSKMLPRWLVILFSSVAFAATMIGTSGCVAVAVGAGAGAAVAYVRGQLETSLSEDYEATVEATNRAIQQLGFAKISEKKDALVAVIVARNATDKKIEIRLDNLARELTKVRIRVDVFGDEPLSLAILDKIKANL